MAWITDIAPKVAYTAVLIWLAFVLISEVWKVWFDRQRELATFTYSVDGKLDTAKATDFTLRIQQQQRFMIATLTGKRKTAEKPVYADNFTAAELDLYATELRKSDLSELEMKIQGFDISKLLTYLRQWVKGRNEVAGRLDTLDGQYQLFAEWRSADPEGGGPIPIFYTLSHPSEARAACDLAGRLVYANVQESLHAAKRTTSARINRWLRGNFSGPDENDPALRLTRILVDDMTDAEFSEFMCAWEVYQKPSAEQVRVTEAAAALRKLLTTERAYPPIHYLQSLLILRAEPLTAVPVGRQHPRTDELVALLERYLALIGPFGIDGQPAEELLAAIQGRAAAGQVAVVGRPVITPGVSLGSQTSPGFSGCCVVLRDGKRYLLTADYALADSATGTPVISPSEIDGGTAADEIGTYAETISRPEGGGVALIALADESRVEATNKLPDGSVITALADPPEPGEKVRLFGRTSRGTEGEVNQIVPTLSVDLTKGPTNIGGIVDVTRFSSGGDGGGAVIDAQGRLVGLHYLGTVSKGDDARSYFLPLKALFEANGLVLAPPPGS